MPPGTCNKCKQLPASEGDSWCNSCSAWEQLGRELAASWDEKGARVLAGDLVLNTARQVRALRSLSAGLARRTAHPSAGNSRRSGGDSPDRRASLPRRRSEGGGETRRPTKEEEVEEDEEESEEEEEGPSPKPRRREKSRDRDPRDRDRGRGPPPEPDQPPKEKPSGYSAGVSRAEPRKRDREKGYEHSKKKSHRTGRRRAGRKHQGLARLAQNPHLKVHRKPPAEFWDLRINCREKHDLDTLGR